MIDKKIYYFWIGGPMPIYAVNCIKSWQRFMPDFEIERIPESYIDMSLIWNQKAYKKKNWAFLSDTARINFFQNHSGIYLDTDILLCKRIPDDFINSPFSIGCERSSLISQGIFVKDNCEVSNNLFNDWYNEYKKCTKFEMSPVIMKPLYKKYDLLPTSDISINKYGMRFYGPKYVNAVYALRKKLFLCKETILLDLSTSSAILGSKYAQTQTSKFIDNHNEIIEFLKTRGVDDLYNRSYEIENVNKNSEDDEW